jgi:hypothetical protein
MPAWCTFMFQPFTVQRNRTPGEREKNAETTKISLKRSPCSQRIVGFNRRWETNDSEFFLSSPETLGGLTTFFAISCSHAPLFGECKRKRGVWLSLRQFYPNKALWSSCQKLSLPEVISNILTSLGSSIYSTSSLSLMPAQPKPTGTAGANSLEIDFHLVLSFV